LHHGEALDMTHYCYIGSAGPAQSATADSPGYGQVTVKESKTGIVVAKLTTDGELQPAGAVELDAHVGWLTQHPTNGHLSCVAGSSVLGLKIGADGMLGAPFTSADAAGDSAFLELTMDGKWALSASYSGSLLSIMPIAGDGSVGAPTDVLYHEVPLNPALADRQEACHPHQVRVDPTQQWALVPDLGASRVWIYGLPGREDGKFLRDQRSKTHLVLPEGAGPRHLDFHPNGKYVYILCELDGNVVLCDWDSDAGTLSPRQSIYVLPDGVICSRAHHSGCSHILVSADGKNVYAASRTDGTIASFAVGEDGTLSKLGENVPCGGVCPRNFQFDLVSSPPRLRICNQDSQNITSIAIGEGGALAVAAKATLETPGVCPQVISVPIRPPAAAGVGAL
jgi:6-phosphogluconolactonase (cycloisomerase 2 family)